jgi:hypothetical protein
MKHEAPALRMRVEQGQLVPTSAWDAERVDSYRNGSIVHAHITQEKNRKLERKYWAILGEVIKSCPVRQRDKEALHKAIRLKLGVVDAYFTFGGVLKVEVKSTSTMDDPEYQRFYEDAMALLHQETGVDPEQLSANSPDVGEDEHEPSEATSPAEDAGSDGDAPRPSTPDVAADPIEPASGGPVEAGAIEAEEEPTAAPASVLSPDDKAFLVRVFKTMKAAVGPDTNVFKRQAMVFTDEIGGMSDLVRAKAKTIRERLQECCGEKPKIGTLAAAKYVAGVIGVDAKELD